MSKKTAKEDLFLKMTTLQYKVKALEKELDEFRSGERYLKLQGDYRRVIAGYIREIEQLRKELADARAQTISTRDRWFEVCCDDWDKFQDALNKLEKDFRKKEERLYAMLKKADERNAEMKREYEEKLAEKDAVIKALTEKLAHSEALLGRDSTNTGLSTGQTPPGKTKHIPNSRRGSGKKKGGQEGHERHVMERPSGAMLAASADHPVSEGEACPTCGSKDLVYTGEWGEKNEVDVEIKVKHVRHKYFFYKCNGCGEIVRTGIAPGHRAEWQYGPSVQALALSLMTTANTAINKIPMILSGITRGTVHPSEGYIAKLPKRAANGLLQFMSDVKAHIKELPLVYWDDTVVMADKSRICLRFYGDEKIAYYTAHQKKDLAGVLEDGILQALPKTARVMHDHNSINYNKAFIFINLECDAHLLRDLQKSADETGHSILKKIKELVSKTIKDRNDLVKKGRSGFDADYIEKFNSKLTGYLAVAQKEAEGNKSSYSGPFERALISRIQKYRENYFAWIEDFSLPVTNNLSERALRGVKTKMRVSGQFASVTTAGYYAAIRSYTETCRRNGINEMEALTRLCDGNPYTLQEILAR